MGAVGRGQRCPSHSDATSATGTNGAAFLHPAYIDSKEAATAILVNAVVNTHRRRGVSEALYGLARFDQMSGGWAETTCGL